MYVGTQTSRDSAGGAEKGRKKEGVESISWRDERSKKRSKLGTFSQRNGKEWMDESRYFSRQINGWVRGIRELEGSCTHAPHMHARMDGCILYRTGAALCK